MPNIQYPGFHGINRVSENMELEKGFPNYCARMRNAIIDSQGTAFVVTGFKTLTAAGGQTIHYSTALRRVAIIDSVAGQLRLLDPETGTVSATHAVAAGNQYDCADWPATSVLYVSNGTNAYRVTVGAIVGLGGSSVGRPIIAYNNHMITVSGVTLRISGSLDPEVFDSNDEIKLQDGGDTVTAMTQAKGILRCHKAGTIYGIVGDLLAGDEKDVQITNFNTLKGALGFRGAIVVNDVEYFVTVDGCYEAKGSEIDRISGPIDGIVSLYTNPTEIASSVGYFSPNWAPNTGRKYCVFNFQGTSSGVSRVYLYDIEYKEWSFLDWASHSTASQLRSIAYSVDNGKTYFCTPSRTFYFENYSTFDGETIRGDVTINVMDAGNRFADKWWGEMFLAPQDLRNGAVGATDSMLSFVGLDGLHPTIALTRDTDVSALMMPKEATSHLLSLRFQQFGGGKPICSGFELQYEIDPERISRSPSSSRLESVKSQMTYGPLVKGGVQNLTPGVYTYTVATGINGLIVGAYVCAGNWAHNEFITVSQLGEGTFQFTIPATRVIASGDKAYWVACTYGKRLYDSYFSGGNGFGLTGTTARLLNWNLEATPEAIFLARPNNSARSLRYSNVDMRSVTLQQGAGAADAQIVSMAFTDGSKDVYFKCGTQSFSPVNHNLGRVPTAVIIFPNQDPVPTFGVTSIVSATEFTYSGTGSYDWLVI